MKKERSTSFERRIRWQVARWQVGVGLAAAAGLLFAFGCAGAKVATGRRAVPDAEIARPSTIVVHDFAVDLSEVVADTFGPEFSSGPGNLSERATLGRDTANALAEKLVAELRDRGIRAERASSGRVAPVSALVIKGQFVTIDEGDRAKRMTIGLGAGSSNLIARVQVYQMTERGLRRIVEAEATAHGSKMPGMAIPIAGGAAAGSLATSAAISGGMNIVKEGRASMDADAGHMAEKIAERAKAFYERQRWL
jgi:hypothetical protein